MKTKRTKIDFSNHELQIIKNEHGIYMYSAGAVSINLKVFFEILLEDFVEDKLNKDGRFQMDKG